MKLLRFGEKGQERPGIFDEQGEIRDISSLVTDIDGAALDADSLQRIAAVDINTLPLVEKGVRLGACIAKPGKFIGIGLNYSDHAAETGMPIPQEPIVFYKADTSISGPNDPIIQPPKSRRLDWEVELGVVIGERAQYVSAAEAEQYIAGYCVVNDVSERGFQLDNSGGQWSKGKGCDSFGPTGPWLVTRDEVADVNNLALWLSVNGERKQTGNTASMIFNVFTLVSYLSEYMTLSPGDIIATGTPPGVGMGMSPRQWLQADDEVCLGVSGLGEQCQRVVLHSG